MSKIDRAGRKLKAEDEKARELEELKAQKNRALGALRDAKDHKPD